ncbi:arsenate reductase (glutaredoxin) [Rhodovulum sulfidophilum]|uniref:arsenate reductase (glutaredoxin) n=1 Tax=Rhodovulum sulfidophilum TaxID=35806 RepID=UPI000952586B|nr:arsenate reductase (glutaredoxin) [Rhodovulum sulfidophilum]MBL3561363.1 arsenate reductase (glutaredoxin) [Rhodovulum sulfidophilum]MBL3594480.1 arsenate reductase (glutaredoxin) [Rhodovulum sulfidophilum]OLS52163.1 arsenate reductase (glutaredoxin) [Rhodovulum sulfidophilum]
MTAIAIWHNPRCSKSRAALALLQERGVEPQVRRYLEVPPNEKELREVLDMLGGPAIGMMRTGEPLFAELELTKDAPDEVLIAAMAAHPKLIERPLAMADGRAVLGRPPERVLELLED